jgi:hypothetical protein
MDRGSGFISEIFERVESLASAVFLSLRRYTSGHMIGLLLILSQLPLQTTLTLYTLFRKSNPSSSANAKPPSTPHYLSSLYSKIQAIEESRWKTPPINHLSYPLTLCREFDMNSLLPFYPLFAFVYRLSLSVV